MSGKLIAAGDLVQVVKGDRVTAELIFHFTDGSIDSDTAVFSQKLQFRLISDHHVQKGPSFPTLTDVLIDAVTGQVTSRYEETGEKKAETNHLDLPSDLANGIILKVFNKLLP